MTKTATIIRHSYKPPCYLEDVLNDLGFEVTDIVSPTHDYSGFDPLKPDLVYIAGGGIAVYQADIYPFLNTEMDIIRARYAANKATIGICLGGQLIAKALGGDVYRGRNGLEYAWHKLNLRDEAANHPVRHLCGSNTNMFHWHQDQFEMPEGATHLASSDQYPNQVFEMNEKTLGFQCHPEVKEKLLYEWSVRLVDVLTGDNPLMSVTEFRESSEKYSGQLNKQVRLFFTEWLERAGIL